MPPLTPDELRRLLQPPQPSEGGRYYKVDPFTLDRARTGDDALSEHLEGTDFTPEEFDDLPAFLRKKGKGKEVVIHNRTLPSLTHILEKGYATNGRRYPAQPHIKPAEENAKKGLELKIRSKL